MLVLVSRLWPMGEKIPGHLDGTLERDPGALRRRDGPGAVTLRSCTLTMAMRARYAASSLK